MVNALIDSLYSRIIVSRRSYWDEVRDRHPVLFRSIYPIYRVYRLHRALRYRQIYRRFADFTMIPKGSYVNNLVLCDQFRHIQGAVVECGVWRGGMIAGIATLFDDAREYHLFDSFEGLPPAQPVDGQAAIDWQTSKQTPRSRSNLKADESFAREAMRRAGVPRFYLHKGWFHQTLPRFNGDIAILRVDGDWYGSTMDVLLNLYDHVVDGGLIVFDDYIYWEGCSKAVHDFFSQRQLSARIRQFNNDICYVQKPA